jgi:hypothetical protein
METNLSEVHGQNVRQNFRTPPPPNVNDFEMSLYMNEYKFSQEEHEGTTGIGVHWNSVPAG